MASHVCNSFVPFRGKLVKPLNLDAVRCAYHCKDILPIERFFVTYGSNEHRYFVLRELYLQVKDKPNFDFGKFAEFADWLREHSMEVSRPQYMEILRMSMYDNQYMTI